MQRTRTHRYTQNSYMHTFLDFRRLPAFMSLTLTGLLLREDLSSAQLRSQFRFRYRIRSRLRPWSTISLSLSHSLCLRLCLSLSTRTCLSLYSHISAWKSHLRILNIVILVSQFRNISRPATKPSAWVKYKRKRFSTVCVFFGTLWFSLLQTPIPPNRGWRKTRLSKSTLLSNTEIVSRRSSCVVLCRIAPTRNPQAKHRHTQKHPKDTTHKHPPLAGS